MKKPLLSLMFFALSVSFVHADWFAIDSTPATDTWGTDVVLNDCFIDSHDARWLSSKFYVELYSGSFYQNPITAALPWSYIPGLNDVDSWLATNVVYFADAFELAQVEGMSGDPNNADASLVFFASLPNDPVPAWDGVASRWAFSPDAQGTWAYQVSIGPEAGVVDPGSGYDASVRFEGWSVITYRGRVIDGRMVPEPTALFLGLAGLAMLIGRRRR